MTNLCSCDYCIEGPFYTDSGKLIHFCDECHAEFVDEAEVGCPGCEAFNRALERWKYREN